VLEDVNKIFLINFLCYIIQHGRHVFVFTFSWELLQHENMYLLVLADRVIQQWCLRPSCHQPAKDRIIWPLFYLKNFILEIVHKENNEKVLWSLNPCIKTAVLLSKKDKV
jgi:hypothetical protein